MGKQWKQCQTLFFWASGPRVLFKSGQGNRGLSACGTPPLLHLDKLSLHTENPFRHPCEEVLPSGLESLPEKSGAEEFLTGNFTRGSADLSLPAVGL